MCEAVARAARTIEQAKAGSATLAGLVSVDALEKAPSYVDHPLSR
ncbi:MAG: hypothetical protein ABI333_15300 [bacterium]